MMDFNPINITKYRQVGKPPLNEMASLPGSLFRRHGALTCSDGRVVGHHVTSKPSLLQVLGKVGRTQQLVSN
jgi:hypothetical protein